MYLPGVVELLPFFLMCIYFVPFMVAAARDNDSYITILVVNLLIGWTGIGWVACMVWAMLGSSGPARSQSQPTYIRRVQ